MAYTHTTFAQFRQHLFDRLGDQLFWSDTGAWPEVTGYLAESFRVWNCLANFWRERVTFATTAGVAFYDLSDPALTTNPAALMQDTRTDQDLVAELMYHLLETQPLDGAALAVEPVDPTVWRGTDQFNLDDLTRALQRRRNQFLYETGLELTHTIVTGALSSEGRMELPETVADVRRASWIAADGTHNHIWRMDEWAATSQAPLWNVSPDTPPSAYSLSLTPPLRLQLIPPPSTTGSLDLLSIDTGTPLDPTTGVLLGVTDDWSWAIKWGALADLLGHEGLARDAARAAYCEQRWQQAIELAKLGGSILHGQLNGVSAPIVALHDLDAMNPGWQDQSGPPDIIACSRDMIALSPVPDNVYSVTLDVIRNAPIPVTGATALNIGPEILDALLDYAHHIASFKEAGAEFAATQRQYDNLIRLAADYNDKLSALATFREALEDRSAREEERRPRREKETVNG